MIPTTLMPFMTTVLPVSSSNQPHFGSAFQPRGIELDNMKPSQLNPEKLIIDMGKNVKAANKLMGSLQDLLGMIAEFPLVSTMIGMVEGVQKILTTLDKQIKLISLVAIKDRLTGLNTRMKFDFDFKHLIEQADMQQQPFAMLMIDGDNFKKVNDVYGHNVGDQVLVKLAHTIKKSITDYPAATPYRFGGEEFIVLMPGVNAKEAQEISQRILDGFPRFEAQGLWSKQESNLRRLFASDSEEAKRNLTVSGGLFHYDGSEALADDLTHPEKLSNVVDQALYQAKAQGRNQIVQVDTERLGDSQGSEQSIPIANLLKGPEGMRQPH